MIHSFPRVAEWWIVIESLNLFTAFAVILFLVFTFSFFTAFGTVKLLTGVHLILYGFKK